MKEISGKTMINKGDLSDHQPVFLPRDFWAHPIRRLTDQRSRTCACRRCEVGTGLHGWCSGGFNLLHSQADRRRQSAVSSSPPGDAEEPLSRGGWDGGGDGIKTGHLILGFSATFSSWRCVSYLEWPVNSFAVVRNFYRTPWRICRVLFLAAAGAGMRKNFFKTAATYKLSFLWQTTA